MISELFIGLLLGVVAGAVIGFVVGTVHGNLQCLIDQAKEKEEDLKMKLIALQAIREYKETEEKK